MASKAFFSPSILFHLEFTTGRKISLMSAWPILGHDFTLKNFPPACSGGSRGRVWGVLPPPPPIRPDLFGTEVLHRQNSVSLIFLMKHAITLFWVPASAREAVLTAPTATGLHTLVFFNRNNSTALKNSYMFSAISLAFVCSLICVDWIRNISAIIFVHEKWLTNGKQIFPSTAFCPWLTQGFPIGEKLILH